MLFSRRPSREEPSPEETGAGAPAPTPPTPPTREDPADSVEIAVETRLKNRARRERSLLSLLELSNELNVRMDLYEIADVALFNLLGHFGCARGALWIFPEDGSKDPVLLRCQGMSPEVSRGIGTVWSRWLTGRPGGMQGPVLVSDLKDVATTPGLDLAERNDIALFSPVSARRSMLGLLALGARVGGADYGPLDREVLQASVNFLGVALENTHLFNMAVENNRRLRQANDQLQEVDRIKSDFLRNMNHELRTPLTVMFAYLDSLLQGETIEGPRRAHLDVVRAEAEKLQGMLINLLDFSKLQEDEHDALIERGDVKAAVEAFADERRPGISADLREFRFTAATEVPPALFDRQRLVRIIDCLVGNAVKFTPRGSILHLRVEAQSDTERDWVRVDVEDNGPGIPEDRLPFVFESFRQGDGSETRTQGGIGMGLSLARALAESMNGTLDVRSGLGRGTTFTLLLPAA